MATFDKRKSRGKMVWRARVRKGGSIHVATFHTKEAAEKWARTQEDAIASGKALPTPEERKRTLGDLLLRYKRTVLLRYDPKEQKDRLRKLEYWNAQIGEVRLSQLSASLIAEVRERLELEGGVRASKPKAATVTRYLAVLRHALQIAVREWEWLDSNPARKVQAPKEPRGRTRFLSADELKRLLDQCQKSKNKRLYPLVLTAIGTGARQGELLNLRWKDVDLVKGTATLHDTKNGESRTLSLNGSVLEVLREHSKVRRIDNDFVFTSSRPKDGIFFPKKSWALVLAKAKIEDFRFHDLRHTAASYYAMSGATLAELAAFLGHKTLAMVKRYSHLTEEHTSGKVAKMVEEFLG